MVGGNQILNHFNGLFSLRLGAGVRNGDLSVVNGYAEGIRRRVWAPIGIPLHGAFTGGGSGGILFGKTEC